MHLVELPDRRKSRQASEREDPFPPSEFVRCTDDLSVYDLNPGQWTRTPGGEVLRRNHDGSRCTITTGAVQ